MKIFGSPDTFVESSSTDLKLGRLVANFDFLRALLAYGDFDEYHLFCPTQKHVRLLREAIAREVPDPKTRERIKLMHHFQLPQQLQSTKYSVFHVGGWYFYYLRLAYMRARFSAHPFVLTGIIHSLNTPDVPEKMRDVLEAPLCEGDAIVMTSECGRQVMKNYERYAAQFLKDRYGVDATFPGQKPVIPLAVTESWLHTKPKSKARAELHLDPDETILLYMGRLSIDKKGDLSPLLYVFRRLLDKHGSGLTLLLAGGSNPANQKMLNQTAQSLGIMSHVRVLPNISDAMKENLYAAADVFVSPIDSLQETFGISIVEAMASGLPVVASGFDGYRELIVDGLTGFLLPTLWGPSPTALDQLGVMVEPTVRQLVISQNVAPSVTTLETVLEQLISQPQLRLKMGEAGRQRARERYVWPVVIRKYLDVWEDLKARLPLGPPASVTDPTSANLYEVFSHYPTDELTSSHRFVLTELGRQCATGVLPMPSMYGEMIPLYSSPMLKGLVEWTSKGPVSWAEIERNPQFGGRTLDTTRFHLLWLVKYGLIDWE